MLVNKTKKTGRKFKCIDVNATITGLYDQYFKKGKIYIEYEAPTGTNTKEIIAVSEDSKLEKFCFLVEKNCFKEIKTLNKN